MLKVITAGQCRAARAILDLKQPDLASLAGLGLSTIVDFERGRRAVSEQAIAAIRTALEDAGIIFLADGATTPGGPGVRLA